MFSFFPIELLRLDLSELEIRVLIALYSFRDKNANTVWPSLESIADRAGIADKTRVSKVTGKLEKRGLITKRKRGFTGGNVYGFANLDESANMEDSYKLDETYSANLDESYKSNLDESAKNKELTIELTNELKDKNTAPAKAVAIRDTKKLSGSELLDTVPDLLPQVADDFLTVRKAKKAPLTATALALIEREASKAGITTAQAIAIATARNWQSFKADWIRDDEGKTYAERTQEFKDKQAEKFYAPLLDMTEDERKAWGFD